MLMEKMASDIALAAELKLYKIAAEGEKEVKKPKAPKAPKSPAPAKAPKAAQPPKSNGGAKPPMSAGEERDLKGRMMQNMDGISNSKLPAYMGRQLLGAGMVPPGIRQAISDKSMVSPYHAIEGAAQAAMPDMATGKRLFKEEVPVMRVPMAVPPGYPPMYVPDNRSDYIDAALDSALTNQHENDYRAKIKNLLGFDF